MSPIDADGMPEIARLCIEARSKLPASSPHRLRVLLDMILIALAREGVVPEPDDAPTSAKLSPPEPPTS